MLALRKIEKSISLPASYDRLEVDKGCNKDLWGGISYDRYIALGYINRKAVDDAVQSIPSKGWALTSNRDDGTNTFYTFNRSGTKTEIAVDLEDHPTVDIPPYNVYIRDNSYPCKG